MAQRGQRGMTTVAQRGALLAIGTAVGTSAGLLAPYVMGQRRRDSSVTA